MHNDDLFLKAIERIAAALERQAEFLKAIERIAAALERQADIMQKGLEVAQTEQENATMLVVATGEVEPPKEGN